MQTHILVDFRANRSLELEDNMDFCLFELILSKIHQSPNKILHIRFASTLSSFQVLATTQSEQANARARGQNLLPVLERDRSLKAFGGTVGERLRNVKSLESGRANGKRFVFW